MPVFSKLFSIFLSLLIVCQLAKQRVCQKEKVGKEIGSGQKAIMSEISDASNDNCHHNTDNPFAHTNVCQTKIRSDLNDLSFVGKSMVAISIRAPNKKIEL